VAKITLMPPKGRSWLLGSFKVPFSSPC
jgi:hypothetical protein